MSFVTPMTTGMAVLDSFFIYSDSFSLFYFMFVRWPTTSNEMSTKNRIVMLMIITMLAEL